MFKLLDKIGFNFNTTHLDSVLFIRLSSIGKCMPGIVVMLRYDAEMVCFFIILLNTFSLHIENFYK